MPGTKPPLHALPLFLATLLLCSCWRSGAADGAGLFGRRGAASENEASREDLFSDEVAIGLRSMEELEERARQKRAASRLASESPAAGRAAPAEAPVDRAGAPRPWWKPGVPHIGNPLAPLAFWRKPAPVEPTGTERRVRPETPVEDAGALVSFPESKAAPLLPDPVARVSPSADAEPRDVRIRKAVARLATADWKAAQDELVDYGAEAVPVLVGILDSKHPSKADLGLAGGSGQYEVGEVAYQVLWTMIVHHSNYGGGPLPVRDSAAWKRWLAQYGPTLDIR